MTSCKLTYVVNGRPASLEFGPARTTIGRGAKCDLVIDDGRVSTNHAAIEFESGRWFVADLGSKNGTILNGRKIEKSLLSNGDILQVGLVEIRCEVHAAPHQPSVVLDDTSMPEAMDMSISMEQLESMLEGQVDPRASISGDLTAAAKVHDKLQGSAWVVQLFKRAFEQLLTSEDLDATFDRVLDLVFDSIPAERGLIGVVDEATGRITPRTARSRDATDTSTIAISTHVARAAINARQAVLARDLPSDERFRGADSVRALNLRAAMCAPLYRAGRVGGLIYVDTQNRHDPFNSTHLGVLTSLAILSAVALDKARMRDEMQREQRIRNQLARYHAPAVVGRIVQSSEALSDQMMVEEREISVLFADICGFTALSEAMTPAQVSQLLNGVFEVLTATVFELEGTLDKFIGDAVMVFFGAPLEQPAHAELAVRAGLLMRDRVAAYNAAHPDVGAVAIRVGINTGPAVVGDIGVPQRKDYTVIGDTVNVASRLESSVAQAGQVVIGPGTYAVVSELFECQPLPARQLRGRTELLQPYLVLGKAQTTPRADADTG
jgi:adenylate cyclase